MKVQVNQDSLKLRSTHQLVVCADDVIILGRSIYTMFVQKLSGLTTVHEVDKA
jgi:hypothetical protein